MRFMSFLIALITSGAAMATTQAANGIYDVVAPVVDGAPASSQSGQVVYDMSVGAFIGLNNTGNWVLMSRPQTLFTTSTSSQFDLNTSGFVSGEWAQMSGNSITLSTGKYILTGYIHESYVSTAASVSQIVAAWGSVNGNNTTSDPIQSSANYTVTGETFFTLFEYSSAVVRAGRFFVPSVQVEVTAPSATIYLDAKINFDTANTSYIKAYISAQRID